MVYYLVLINLFSFLVFLIDKEKARKNKYRISEKFLFTCALLGGGFGSYLGMYVAHHKTKRYSFMIGIPLIMVIQVVLYYIFIGR